MAGNDTLPPPLVLFPDGLPDEETSAEAAAERALSADPAESDFGERSDFWDADGFPTDRNLGNAVQVWSVMQNQGEASAEDHRPATVQEAAAAFKTTADRIRAAVRSHYWMFLDGDNIEHEGE